LIFLQKKFQEPIHSFFTRSPIGWCQTSPAVYAIQVSPPRPWKSAHMTAQLSKANEIEGRPADDTGGQLWQSVYSRTSGSLKKPMTDQAVAPPLDQFADSRGAPGISIDYDNQGQVAAITINNESLYKNVDAAEPSLLASGKNFSSLADDGLSAMLFSPSEQSKTGTTEGWQ
jgi:hypothetical protein